MLEFYLKILFIFCYSIADLFTYFMRKLIDERFK